MAAVMVRDDVARALDGSAIDREENVARMYPGNVGRRSWCDVDGGYSLSTGSPKHTVLDLMPLRSHDDVRCAQHDERGRNDESKDRPSPWTPGGIRRVMPVGNRQTSSLTVTSGQLENGHVRAAREFQAAVR
jgi:hypothetical protein